MKTTQKSFSILLICCVLFIILNIWTLKDGHNWGGDFSQYIIHARNILEHREYSFSYNLDRDIAYPPGLPLVLAPLINYFGIDFRVLKLPNIFFWLFYVLALYLLMKNRFDKESALLGALVFLFSPYFFWFKQNVISDIPFLFFATSSLYTLTEYFRDDASNNTRRKTLLLMLSLASMSLAFLFRFAGILLFLSTAMYIFVSQKDKKTLLFLVFTLALMIWIHNIVGASATYHVEAVSMPLSRWCSLSYQRVIRIFFYVVTFFIPFKTAFSVPIISALKWGIIVIAPLTFMTILIFFLRKIAKQTISFLECFFLLYYLTIIVWWVEGGGRYVLPIIGPAVIILYETLKKPTQQLFEKTFKSRLFTADRFIKGLFLFLLFHNILSITLYFHFNDDAIRKGEVVQMARWFAKNTSPNERFMFQRPRVLGLLTGRQGAVFLIRPQDNLNARIIKHGIDYLVITKSKPDAALIAEERKKPLFSANDLNRKYFIIDDPATEFFIREIDMQIFDITAVWENRDYKIFKITQKHNKLSSFTPFCKSDILHTYFKLARNN